MKNFFKCFPKCLIATLDDKAATGAEPRRKALGELVSNQKREKWTLEALEKLNEKGAGIFFAYNQIKDSRSTENTVGINAWAMEIDNIPKSEQWKKILKSPLNPSIVVESSNSYHCYWLAKDATVENARRINTCLVQRFNSDPALKDVSRLLRIPGFYHNKRDPFMVRIELDDYDVKYTEKEMLEAFPYTEEKKQNVKMPEWKPVDTDNFWIGANSMNPVAALERLSGSGLVNGEVFSFRKRSGGGLYIDVNGSPADAWIDPTGGIGSGKGAGPTIVNWLRFYGHDFKEIADWIKENCDDLLPKRLAKPKTQVITNKRFIPYTWGTEYLDNKFWALKRHEVACLAGVTSSGKTAFAYHLARENAKLGHKVCYVVLEMTGLEIAERVASDCAGFTVKEDRWNQFPEVKKKIYEEKRKELLNFENLTMLDMPVVSIEKIFGEVVASGEYDLIFIDNFDRIGKSEGIINGHDHDNHKIKTIMDFTKERNIPIKVIHHINSKKPLRKGGYGLSDLRGSGKVTDECNTVLYLSRDVRKDATLEQRSKFFIQTKKHRRKGELLSARIVFKEGDFVDEVGPEWESEEYWQNDI